MRKSGLPLLVAVVGALLVSACFEKSPERAARDAKLAAGEALPYSQVKMPDGSIVQAYEARVNGSWFVLFPGFSTEMSCGKSCTVHYATGNLMPGAQAVPQPNAGSDSPVLSGLAKLTKEERAALGLSAVNEARLSGLGKLTREEREALGLSEAVLEALPRR